jgi:cysteinyl-tRNA synthetase
MSDDRKKAEHPPWFAPQTASPLPPLSVLNSLTSQKETFQPTSGNQVGWYICGPTVYDSAHLGHARAYVTFDIVRRIMSDYFNYDVFFVMNITDIDDKIILKARRNHLVADYTSRCLSGAVSNKQACDDSIAALTSAQRKLEAKASGLRAAAATQPTNQAEDSRKQADLEAKRAEGTGVTIELVRALFSAEAGVAEAAVRKLLSNAAAAAAANALSGDDDAEHDEKKVAVAIDQAAKNAHDAPLSPEMLSSSALMSRALDVARESLAEWLDSQFGADVTDQQIFQKHARTYEAEFLEDMRSLGVRESDVLTRVTEYVPDVVSFVQRIIANGLGYESGGSVYFDTAAFSAAKHNYAKLAPWAVGNSALQEEGEGALSAGRDSGEKRNAGDFALWKKSKAGEPYWESPWGNGRPGWHIECSAMASDLLGTRLDVHAGGEDLRFPHHDNEIAQCEAFFGSQQWVNYFLHAGHLHIEGLKMSKSLKNFITIREMLKHYSARAIRILFLLQSWHSRMNFSKNGLREATVKEKQLKEFFLNVKSVMRNINAVPVAENTQRWSAADRALHETLLKAQDSVHRALLDNFDYPTAMLTIFGMFCVNCSF